MDFSQKIIIISIGFMVWAILAPRFNNPKYAELFLAYMTALLCSLIASSELLTTKPAAFFFTIGGVLAFCWEVVRKTIRITVRK